jgi:hypothetical protein
MGNAAYIIKQATYNKSKDGTVPVFVRNTYKAD